MWKSVLEERIELIGCYWWRGCFGAGECCVDAGGKTTSKVSEERLQNGVWAIAGSLSLEPPKYSGRLVSTLPHLPGYQGKDYSYQ